MTRVAIVTGAAGGIGVAILRRLAQSGWHLAAADVDGGRLNSAVHAPELSAHVVEPFLVDVGDEDSVVTMVGAVHERFGRIDALINNAGIVGTRAPIWEIPRGEWEHILAVDLHSVYYCSRAAIPHMLERGWGRIVNIASIAGKDGNPYAAAYSTAKAGVIGLTKSMGRELARLGILANCITPAEIDTPILGTPPKAELERWLAQIPMGRLGQPIEVANLVEWLVSDECSFSTGGVFDLSGGHSTY